MTRKIFALAGAALALTLAGSQAEAQRASTFGISAGATLPRTTLASVDAQTGFNLGASLGFVSPLFPAGFRVDGTWHQFELEEHGTTGHEGENYRVLGLTGNALLSLPIEGLSPYLIGGLGVFNTRPPEAHGTTENDFGWNLGAGVRFQLTGFNTYAEARWTRINVESGNVNIVPIVFGIMF